MTNLAGSWPPGVMTASPVGRPEGKTVRLSSWHAERMVGPPARWMAPSTPPPPKREPFAAFTMASTFWRVISPEMARTVPSRKLCIENARAFGCARAGRLQRASARERQREREVEEGREVSLRRDDALLVAFGTARRGIDAGDRPRGHERERDGMRSVERGVHRHDRAGARELGRDDLADLDVEHLSHRRREERNPARELPDDGIEGGAEDGPDGVRAFDEEARVKVHVAGKLHGPAEERASALVGREIRRGDRLSGRSRERKTRGGERCVFAGSGGLGILELKDQRQIGRLHAFAGPAVVLHLDGNEGDRKCRGGGRRGFSRTGLRFAHRLTSDGAAFRSDSFTF